MLYPLTLKGTQMVLKKISAETVMRRTLKRYFREKRGKRNFLKFEFSNI